MMWIYSRSRRGHTTDHRLSRVHVYLCRWRAIVWRRNIALIMMSRVRRMWIVIAIIVRLLLIWIIIVMLSLLVHMWGVVALTGYRWLNRSWRLDHVCSRIIIFRWTWIVSSIIILTWRSGITVPVILTIWWNRRPWNSFSTSHIIVSRHSLICPSECSRRGGVYGNRRRRRFSPNFLRSWPRNDIFKLNRFVNLLLRNILLTFIEGEIKQLIKNELLFSHRAVCGMVRLVIGCGFF